MLLINSIYNIFRVCKVQHKKNPISIYELQEKDSNEVQLNSEDIALLQNLNNSENSVRIKERNIKIKKHIDFRNMISNEFGVTSSYKNQKDYITIGNSNIEVDTTNEGKNLLEKEKLEKEKLKKEKEREREKEQLKERERLQREQKEQRDQQQREQAQRDLAKKEADKLRKAELKKKEAEEKAKRKKEKEDKLKQKQKLKEKKKTESVPE